MLYKLVQDYAGIIVRYAVTDFRQFGNAASLVAHIELIDHSVLYIKDYLFIDGTRKYSFHWQKANGQLRMRWDNSLHHTHIITFPHHKHTAEEVLPSYERNLSDILESIRQALSS